LGTGQNWLGLEQNMVRASPPALAKKRKDAAPSVREQYKPEVNKLEAHCGREPERSRWGARPGGLGF